MYENSIASSLSGPLYNPIGGDDYQSWLKKQQYPQMQQAPAQNTVGQTLSAAVQPVQAASSGMPTNSWHGDASGIPDAQTSAQQASMSEGQRAATDTARTSTTAVGGPSTSSSSSSGDKGFFDHSRLAPSDVERNIGLAAGLLMPGLAPTLTAGIGLAELAYSGGKWLYNKFSNPDAPGPGTPLNESPYSNYGNWYSNYAAAHAGSDTNDSTQSEGTPTGYTTGSGVTYTQTPSNSTPTNSWHSTPDSQTGINNNAGNTYTPSDSDSTG